MSTQTISTISSEIPSEVEEKIPTIEVSDIPADVETEPSKSSFDYQALTVPMPWYMAGYIRDNLFSFKTNAGKKIRPVSQKTRAVELVVPVLNIWALKDEHSVFGQALHLSDKDMERVAYYACYLVLSSSVPDVVPGTVYNEAELRNCMDTYGDKVVCKTGAEALEEYAKILGVNIPAIFHYIPIFFPDKNVCSDADSERLCDICKDLQYLYARVMRRNDRVKRLRELGAPEIILRNESRMLQEYVDALLENGLRGKPSCYEDGTQLYSMADLLVD